MAQVTTVAKTNILPKSGPGAVGFAVRRKVNGNVDGRLWTNLDGTARPVQTMNVKTITASTTLTAAESGAKIIYNAAGTLVLTLPKPAAGLEFELFVKTAATSGNGHTVQANGTAEKFFFKGDAATGVANKKLKNTQATGAQGDGVYMWSDGTDWFVFADAGTWLLF